MIKLEYIENKQEINEENNEQMIAAIKKAAESQKQAGLGNPKETVAMLLEKYSLPLLVKDFKEIKKPSSFHFIPFMKKYSWGDYAELALDEGSESPTQFPRLVQVEMDSDLNKITMTVDGISKTAAIPLIPMSVQELVKRVKEKVPSMKLHLLFIPMWERKPNPDPVLVGSACGRFFELASWGGDDAVLQEFMESL